MKSVYGDVLVIPKHHFASDLPDQHERHGTLYSCFTQERRHKRIKKWTKDRTQLRGYETSVMEELAIENCFDLSESFVTTGALGATHTFKTLRKAVAAWLELGDNDTVETVENPRER